MISGATRLLANARAIVPPAKAASRKVRTQKPQKGGPKLHGAVDPRTTLVDGTEIADLDDLKQYLLEQRRDQFAEAVVRKTLSYALGRYLDFSDTQAVNEITAQFAKDNYRMRGLIHAIVVSEPFQTK